MIAYALHLGYQEINLFGIDMTIQSEYEYERPCVLYWIGKAESLGIKVNNMSNYGFFMYGYDSQKLNKLTESLTSKLVYATNKIKEKDISNDEKNQWIGQAYTLKQILREIKS